MFNGYINVANEFQRIKPNIFCLSEGIQKVYNVMFDIPKEKTWITPNGVNTESFEYVDDPTHPDRSIYLDPRLTIANVNIFSRVLKVCGLQVTSQMIDSIKRKIILVSGLRTNCSMN